MATSKINGDINKFLRHNDLYVNYREYQSSQADVIIPPCPVTLLSSESRRLTEKVQRFQIFNENSDLYIDYFLSWPVFQNGLADMLAHGVPAPLPLQNMDDDACLLLIQELRRQGVLVTGTAQKTVARWDVQDDDTLAGLLTAEENTQIAAPAEPVFRQRRVGGRATGTNEPFYDVRDQLGRILIGNVPIQVLAPILLGVRLQVPPTALRDLFLTPKISQESLNEARLTLTQNYCSAAQVITNQADLAAIDELPVSQGAAHRVDQYQWENAVDELGYPVAPADMANAFDHIYHAADYQEETAGRQLSDWLIKLATRCGVIVSRREQRQVVFSDVDFLTVRDGVVSLLKQREGPQHPQLTNTVYTLTAAGADEPTLDDLTFSELVTSLVMTAKLQGILNFDD